MKLFLFPLIALLPACSTTIYDPVTGNKVARIQSDASNIAFSRSPDGAVSFTADQLSNSQPTLAAGKVLTSAVTAAGTAISAVSAVKAYETINKPIR